MGSFKKPGLMKQYSAMRNRKSGGQLECYSVEDLRASVPMNLMVNPYATRLVCNRAQATFQYLCQSL